MKIEKHALAGVPFKAAHSSGGEMTPTIIVLHDTAGRMDAGSSVGWFCSEDCNTSAHIVVERDGSLTQLVPFNRKAWHAGASTYNGKTGCNAFAIGIEIVNPGKLDKDGRAWFHKKTEKGYAGAKRVKTKEHGDGYWLDYTPEQIDAVTALCRDLVETYGITDITTHWAVSPGRKVDTNPLFPLEDVKRAVFVPEPAPVVAAVPSRKAAVASSGEAGAAAGALTLFGLSIADALNYGGQFLGIIKSYGLVAVAALLLVAALMFSAIKFFQRQDLAEGRYTPRKPS